MTKPEMELVEEMAEALKDIVDIHCFKWPCSRSWCEKTHKRAQEVLAKYETWKQDAGGKRLCSGQNGIGVSNAK